MKHKHKFYPINEVYSFDIDHKKKIEILKEKIKEWEEQLEKKNGFYPNIPREINFPVMNRRKWVCECGAWKWVEEK